MFVATTLQGLLMKQNDRSIDHREEKHNMTDSNSSNNLTDTQLQTLLANEHIRKYLLKAGLINRRGEIVPKEEYGLARKRHSRRRGHSGDQQLYTATERKRTLPASARRPFYSTTRQKNVSKLKPSPPPVSRDAVSHNRQIKSVAVTQPAVTSKKQSPTRLSSSHRPRRPRSQSIRRADILKRPIPITERCQVTMIYYGPQTPIEYDSSWFEPDGDEILVMQQHCGGENLIVYKGFLKPNETFTFESRRHRDFPFGLAFYVKGLIDSRLSACCECKHKHGVRLGGRRGLFGITKVQNSLPCRRCRFERRMKKLAKSRSKSPIAIDPSRYQTSIVPRSEPVMRTPSSHEQERLTPTRSSLSNVLNHKPQATSSPKEEKNGETYTLDFDEPENKIHSLNSTPREHEVMKFGTPEPLATKNDDDDQHPSSVVSSIKLSDDEATTSISEDFNDDFQPVRSVSPGNDKED